MWICVSASAKNTTQQQQIKFEKIEIEIKKETNKRTNNNKWNASFAQVCCMFFAKQPRKHKSTTKFKQKSKWFKKLIRYEKQQQMSTSIFLIKNKQTTIVCM